MKVATHHNHNPVSAAEMPLDQLVKNPALSEKDKIGELSRQFEAMLLRQILQQTQKTVIKSKLTEDSATSGIYQDMITYHLAESISKSGSFGFAQSLQEELSRQLSAHPPEEEKIEN